MKKSQETSKAQIGNDNFIYLFFGLLEGQWRMWLVELDDMRPTAECSWLVQGLNTSLRYVARAAEKWAGWWRRFNSTATTFCFPFLNWRQRGGVIDWLISVFPSQIAWHPLYWGPVLIVPSKLSFLIVNIGINK